MVVGNLDHKNARDGLPFQAAVGFAGHRIMIRLKYEPPGMNKVNRKLALSVLAQLVAPKRWKMSRILQGVECLKFSEALLQPPGDGRSPRSVHLFFRGAHLLEPA
ncbi:MAG: hypothetical protein RDV41_03205 [Planctomycetota bacterium]|nr:hypothetical protein [Planctomycetota bacterium]